MDMTIELNGLTKAQAIAIEDMMATWNSLGNVGSSRWTAFYADGDGNFRPEIKVNGKKPLSTAFLTHNQKWGEFSENDVYSIDFDAIAWKLHDD